MTKLTELTIEKAKLGLAKKEFSARELTQAHLDAMTKARDLNAYIVETPEIALAQANAADKNGNKGLLGGIPIVKKNSEIARNASK